MANWVGGCVNGCSKYCVPQLARNDIISETNQSKKSFTNQSKQISFFLRNQHANLTFFLQGVKNEIFFPEKNFDA